MENNYPSTRKKFLKTTGTLAGGSILVTLFADYLIKRFISQQDGWQYLARIAG